MIETYDLTNPEKPTIVKDPQAVLDYSASWAAWLAGVNDTLVSAAVTAETPLVVQGDVTFSAGVVTAMIGGGALNKLHRVTFSIFTAAGRADQRSIYLRVRDR